MTQTYEVQDGTSKITFEGDLLASASSRRSDSSRWTELSLYRTVGGNYMLYKVGRSLVTHYPPCEEPKNPGRWDDEHPGEEPDEIGVEFHDCVPTTYMLDNLIIEKDRHWTFVSPDASAVIDELHTRKGGGTLPRASVALLGEAARMDDGIASAYNVRHIA